jgi:hypothetical protein
MKTDSLNTIQQVPQRVKLETPLGSIESDSGNPILDGVIVVSAVLILYICKKVVDKLFKR